MEPEAHFKRYREKGENGMIFSCNCHVKAIVDCLKTQTRRRQVLNYKKGRLYSIQPKRTAKGIPEGKILIIAKVVETREKDYPISPEDAYAEGGYIPEEYEQLYEKLHPSWQNRTKITFQFVPQQVLEQLTLRTSEVISIDEKNSAKTE